MPSADVCPRKTSRSRTVELSATKTMASAVISALTAAGRGPHLTPLTGARPTLCAAVSKAKNEKQKCLRRKSDLV